MANTICIASFCTSFIYRLGDSTIVKYDAYEWIPAASRRVINLLYLKKRNLRNGQE
ncbi:hypothetical protein HanRHA438_Chr09g0404311 [Helianthus annuus]|nr:hypothetical protein HanRHA438_Chr09g0404311 [Helianthus annuus]